MTDCITPRIYVACLAAYNNGKLHGAWIDANQDPDAIREEVARMLAASPEPDAEEWAIHDHEEFCGLSIGEWTGFDEVSRLAAFAAEHGSLGAALIEQGHAEDPDDAERMLDDRYLGTYPTVADYAEELTDETVTLPDFVANYIDYERMARDMELGGDIVTVEVDGETHLFTGW